MDPGSRDIHIIFSLLKTTPLWDSALRVSYPLYSSVSVTRLTLSVNVTEELNRLSALITYERDKRKPICFPTLCCNAFRKWPRKEGLEEQTQSRLWHKIMSSVVFVTALLFGKLQTTFFFFLGVSLSCTSGISRWSYDHLFRGFALSSAPQWIDNNIVRPINTKPFYFS